jgi:hypothetical protein
VPIAQSGYGGGGGPSLLALMIASRREHKSFVMSSSTGVLTMMLSAWTGITGSAASTTAIIAMAVKSLLKRDEKIITRMVFLSRETIQIVRYGWPTVSFNYRLNYCPVL